MVSWLIGAAMLLVMILIMSEHIGRELDDRLAALFAVTATLVVTGGTWWHMVQSDSPAWQVIGWSIPVALAVAALRTWLKAWRKSRRMTWN